MYCVAVCESLSDEIEQLAPLLDKYLSERPDSELCFSRFCSGKELLAAVEAGHSFDLLLLSKAKQEELFPVLDLLTACNKQRDDGYFILQAPKCVTKIPFSQMCYIELKGRALCVHLIDGRTLNSTSIRTTFSAAVAPLMTDSRFLSAHKSFVINMDMVSGLTDSSFIMSDGTEVPVPRNKYAGAKTAYFDYISSRGVGKLGGK